MYAQADVPHLEQEIATSSQPPTEMGKTSLQPSSDIELSSEAEVDSHHAANFSQTVLNSSYSVKIS